MKEKPNDSNEVNTTSNINNANNIPNNIADLQIVTATLSPVLQSQTVTFINVGGSHLHQNASHTAKAIAERAKNQQIQDNQKSNMTRVMEELKQRQQIKDQKSGNLEKVRSF